jgi:citrate synthase
LLLSAFALNKKGNEMKQTRRFLTAKEAAETLNISQATLYAYVSRGWVRSEPTGGKRRTKQYYAEDIQRLKERQEQRRNPAEAATTAAAAALHFGQPVLESAVTLIADGRFYYRGYDATMLARQYTLEQVAVLLWDETAEQPTAWEKTAAALFTAPLPPPTPRFQTIQDQVSDLSPMERFQILWPLAAANDFSAYDFRPEAVRQTGARILKLLAAIAAGVSPDGRTVAAALQHGWLPDEPQAATWLNETLVLCADHELNLSAFTARCVASGETTLYGVVSAGLAALQGARHGGFTGRVEALFREAGTPEQARSALKARLKRGDHISGFGHPLYPEGDPRARSLLALAKRARPNSAAVHLAEAINEATQTLVGLSPTLDFGLVTLSLALELPPGSPLALFAIGRTAGWIGHALEQQTLKQLIRPRASYIGPAIRRR